MKITIIKKAEVKKTDISICPFVIEGVPESKR
jgi:hypothetical protein